MATGCGNQGLGVMKGKDGDRMWELGWNQGLGILKDKDGGWKLELWWNQEFGVFEGYRWQPEGELW